MVKLSLKQPVCEEFSFMSDGLCLKGTLHLPLSDTPVPLVIGSHGLFANADSPKQMALARHCNTCGIGYLRFDHRGCGRSQGDFDTMTSLETRCRDLRSAVRAIGQRADIAPRVGFFGSSLGGAVCLSTAAAWGVDALVTFAAPVSSGVIDAALSSEEKFRQSAFYRQDFQFDLSNQLSNVHDCLIFHGEKDSIVPVAHAEIIYRRVRRPKQLVVQPGGDHRMSSQNLQQAFAARAVQWFAERLVPK